MGRAFTKSLLRHSSLLGRGPIPRAQDKIYHASYITLPFVWSRHHVSVLQSCPIDGSERWNASSRAAGRERHAIVLLTLQSSAAFPGLPHSETCTHCIRRSFCAGPPYARTSCYIRNSVNKDLDKASFPHLRLIFRRGRISWHEDSANSHSRVYSTLPPHRSSTRYNLLIASIWCVVNNIFSNLLYTAYCRWNLAFSSL